MSYGRRIGQYKRNLRRRRKTAAELINTYKTLDGVVCNAGNIKKRHYGKPFFAAGKDLLKTKAYKADGKRGNPRESGRRGI